MFVVKRKKRRGKHAIAIPFCISVVTSMWGSLICAITFVLSVFLVIPLVLEFRHRENLGMCFVIAISSIPINTTVSYKIIKLLSWGSLTISSVLYGILAYFILLCVEEVIFGVITRLIWRKKHRFDFI